MIVVERKWFLMEFQNSFKINLKYFLNESSVFHKYDQNNLNIISRYYEIFDVL